MNDIFLTIKINNNNTKFVKVQKFSQETNQLVYSDFVYTGKIHFFY